MYFWKIIEQMANNLYPLQGDIYNFTVLMNHRHPPHVLMNTENMRPSEYTRTQSLNKIVFVFTKQLPQLP